MSNYFTKNHLLICIILQTLLFSFNQCAQIQYFQKLDVRETAGFKEIEYDTKHIKTKKTVVILADAEGTEITDIIVPYSLLKKAGFNVYILSNKKQPVILWKGLGILPHFQIEEIPFDFDAVVIPNVFHPKDPIIQKFLKSTQVPILSICEGAKVIGESGLFEGYKITTHASSFVDLEKKYSKLEWVRGKKFLKDRNLISTAGVASSIEGTLSLISQLSDQNVLKNVKKDIKYPYKDLIQSYSAEGVSFTDQLRILGKVSLDSDPQYRFQLYEGINELDLALTLDVWTRTFPSSIGAISKNLVKTENGLLIFGLVEDTPNSILLCIHPCQNESKTKTIIEINNKDMYTLDANLDKVKQIYGKKFSLVVRRLMDY